MSYHHLQGRMPHEDIHQLFLAASTCKTSEDVEKLGKRLRYISEVFSTVIREFRSSLLAHERNRGKELITTMPSAAPAVVVRDNNNDNDNRGDKSAESLPLLEALMVATKAEDSRDRRPSTITTQELPMLAKGKMGCFATFKQWKEMSIGGYDERASAIVTLVIHDRLDVVRGMIVGGLDISPLYRLSCHVGGGLHTSLETNIEAYVWLNQLLLLSIEGTMPWSVLREHVGMPRGVPGDFSDTHNPQDVSVCRVLAAFRTLHELCDAYDNRDYRNATHTRELQALVTDRLLTVETLSAYIKEHVFPEIYRLTHVLVLNELVHRSSNARVCVDDILSSGVLVDPRTLDAQCCGDIAGVVHDTIAAVLRGAIPQIPGVRRADLFKADGHR